MAKESIIGAFPVSTQLGPDTEFLTIFLTQSRMILAYQGKKTLGSLSVMRLTGRFGTGKTPWEFETKGVKDGAKWEAAPERVLKSNKKNFDINYSDVVRVEINSGAFPTGIMLLTKDEKLQFLTTTSFDYVAKVLSDSLGEKASIVQRR